MYQYTSLLLVMCLALQLKALNYQWIRKSPKDGLTSEEEKFLLNVHNFYRRAIQKGLSAAEPFGHGQSSDMRELAWNDKLAADAQRWSRACGGDPHDKEHERGFSGQNMAGLPSRERILEFAIVNWADNEYNYYKYGARKFDNIQTLLKSVPIGHYTQMVWARSSQIGCGFSRCDGHTFARLICNFMPSGNYEGYEIYKKGTPCSQCDPGYGFCNENLCSKSCNRRNCRCTVHKQDCEHNGGMYDGKKCFCHCPAGRMGLNCQEGCSDAMKGKRMRMCDRRYCRPRSEKYHYNELFCPKTCGRCEVDCTNVQSNCAHFKNLGYCKKHKATMTLKCRKECNFCKTCAVNVAQCSYNGGIFNRTSCECPCPDGKMRKPCEKDRVINQGIVCSSDAEQLLIFAAAAMFLNRGSFHF